jgi:hypothetical protein
MMSWRDQLAAHQPKPPQNTLLPISQPTPRLYYHESGGYYSDAPDPQFNVRRAEPQAPIKPPVHMTEPTSDIPQSDNNMYYVAAAAAALAALYLLRKQ